MKKKKFFGIIAGLAMAASLCCSAAFLTACSEPEAGPQGPQGIQGETGATGATGKSAYDIAKEHGFTGSEEEWLESIKGKNGIDGAVTVTKLNYVSYKNVGENVSESDKDQFDKWGIRHRLLISYKNADDQEKTLLSVDSLDIVDQNVFYEAGSSDEIWQLIDFNVRRISLKNDVLLTGNTPVEQSNSKYTSVAAFTDDVEFDFKGNALVLEADRIEIAENASVTFKNGEIKRLNRIPTADASLHGKIVDADIDGAEHAGRSVYVPATYADGKQVASDAELKRTAVYDHLSGTPVSGKVIAPDGTSGAASNATIHVNNYCSVKLDTVDFFTFFTGIFVDGLSSSVEVVNNSVIDAEGVFGIGTNASGSSQWNVVVSVKDSTINASHINTRHKIIPSAIVPATAIMINVPGSLIVENSTLSATSQALIVRGGHAVARNSRILAQSVFPYERSSMEDNKNWGSSNTVPNAAVVVGNKNAGYQYYADCTLTNCEVKYNQFPYARYPSGWEIVYVLGNTGTDGSGYNANGEWIGATFTYDAMTFARSGDVNFHVENMNKTTGNVYRPEMLLNANEWYEADTQRKIEDLMDYGAKNIRLTKDLNLEANENGGDYAGYTVIDRDIQFGLNGHKLTIISKGIKIVNNADVLFQNGELVMNSTPKPTADMVYGDYAVSVGEFCSLSLEAVKMYANRSAIFMDGKAATLNVTADSEVRAGGFYGIGTNVNGTTDFGVIITIKYSKIIAGVANGVADANPQTDASRFGVAVLMNVPGTLKVEKSSYLAGYTQGVILRNGIAIIENSTVEALGGNSALDQYATATQGGTHAEWGKGYNVPNAAIVIGTYRTAGDGNYLYQGRTEAVLRNVTLKKANAATAYVFMHNDASTDNDDPAVVTFDTLTAMKTLGKDNVNGELITKCDVNHGKLEIWDERGASGTN